MKSVIRWAVRNSPAINTLMIGALALGALSIFGMRREVFPEFELEILLVSVPYPGADPNKVEKGICQKIEEATRSIDGIKKQTAVAQENAGFVILELETGVNAQKILNEVRSEVDRIPSFPEKAERPVVQQITMRTPAIRVALIGPDSDDQNSDLTMRHLAEEIRDELIQLDHVSQAEITGARPFQIDVEISENVLRSHNLTLKKVAAKIFNENMELPGGVVKAQGQEILVKGKPKAETGAEIAKLPLVVNKEANVFLTVGDLATVNDEFSDHVSITRINGKPGVVLTVSRTAREDLLAVTQAVRNYVAEKRVPPGYQLDVFDDRSIDVKERMDLLTTNGLQGLVLVLLALALFLDTRLAFWVALGIPISILAACAILYFSGQTLNMLSMFAFLMALGIVVDDAIVVGENIYAHRQRGVSFVRAAIDGTLEVLPSVVTSVSTTIVAFMPMLFVTGVMGKFFAVLPLAMIAMLVISLLECFTLLPCHLAHSENPAEKRLGLIARAEMFRERLPFFLRATIGLIIVGVAALLVFLLYPFRKFESGLRFISSRVNRLLLVFGSRVYLPALRLGLHNPAIVICAAVAVLALTIGFVRGGAIPFIVFPKLDSKSIVAVVKFPDGTPESVTDKATVMLEKAILNVNKRNNDEGLPIVNLTHRAVGYSTRQAMAGRAEATGAHLGSVTVELVDTSKRSITSDQILALWRAEWRRLNPGGEFPGVDSIQFANNTMGPRGKAVEFRLLAPSDKIAELEKAVEETKKKLATYNGVEDVEDDSQPGKTEYVYRIKDNAIAMGISQGDLIGTMHASYFGEEVMRLQRGRHEVKLMVRYPTSERKKLASLDEIRLRADDGAERPVTELADKKVGQSYTEINRVDQLRSITITSEVDDARGNARSIVLDLRDNFIPELKKKYPWLKVRWEGQQQQTVESMQSLFIGFAIAVVVMFLILTLEFGSYIQPLLIMTIIPFGAVGAVFGHAIMGLPLTMFSVLGLVALTGVVVNDSIVLIDFINHRVRRGMPIREALLDAGLRRLRPVILTSVTTVAGLLPLLLERSFQAQLLIPMAVSLSFGLIVTTVLVLFLLPTFYSIYASLFPPQIEKEEHEPVAQDEQTKSIAHEDDSVDDVPVLATAANGSGKEEQTVIDGAIART